MDECGTPGPVAKTCVPNAGDPGGGSHAVTNTWCSQIKKKTWVSEGS